MDLSKLNVAVVHYRFSESPGTVVEDPVKVLTVDLGANDVLCTKVDYYIVINVKEEQIQLLCKQLKLSTCQLQRYSEANSRQS